MDDTALVPKIRNGDTHAFEALFRRYYESLVSFASGMLRTPDAAYDVVSDVFATVWEQRVQWQPVSVKAYLYGAVRNRAYNRLRDAKDFVMWDDAGEREITLSHTPALLTDAMLVRDEEIAALRTAIGQLPALRRAVMILRWQQGMSFEEIAEVLGISSNAVQLHISRALKFLRETVPGAIG